MSEEKRAFDKLPVTRGQEIEPASDVERTHGDDGSQMDLQYITIFGFANVDVARAEARALLGDRARIFSLIAQTERHALDGRVVGYFVMPEGSFCSCCGAKGPTVFPPKGRILHE